MSDRREFRDLATPAAAREAIAELELTPDPETVPLASARGRILTERVDAEIDVPGFDRASMDGYAVRARDTFGADETDPSKLTLVGAVHAGAPPAVTVESGTCAEISTGAVLPDGADAVVMVERTDEVHPETADADDNLAGSAQRDASANASQQPASNNDGTEESSTRIAVRTAVAPGDHVMVAGADIAAGARALGPGTRLTPREIGLCSALGIDEVPVRGKPTVGIISTGDELVRPGEALDPTRGEIYDVNSTTISAAVAEAGGNPVLYPHAGDEYAEMERLLRRAADECDLVCSSGSTSASAVDVIYRVIEDRGELLLHGVSVKPGKPMIVGRIDRADGGASAYIGLPGYPVSALTIFRTFVAPAIRSAAGLAAPPTATVEGRMGVRERYGEGRLRLMPVGLLDLGESTGQVQPVDQPKSVDQTESVDPTKSAPSVDRTANSDRTTSSDRTASSGRSHGDELDSRPLVYPVDKGSGATTSLVEADGIVSVDPDTEYLERGESVTVQLFSPEVRPPTLLGVGEDDPAFNRVLDRLSNPRYLPIGSREGLRRLRDGVPDIAVTAGPTNRDVEAVTLGQFEREWGLVVPDGNPADVTGINSLLDNDLRFVNRPPNSGLRRSFDAELAALADDRAGTTQHELTEQIDGYGWTVRAYESPVRRVREGKADVGLGLQETATRLGCGFVSLGTQSVQVLAAPDRSDREAVSQLARVLDDLPSITDTMDGYPTR